MGLISKSMVKSKLDNKKCPEDTLTWTEFEIKIKGLGSVDTKTYIILNLINNNILFIITTPFYIQLDTSKLFCYYNLNLALKRNV